MRARIVAVSIGGGIRSGKLGLTMRQPFLGKIEWIEEEVFGPKEEKKEAAEVKEEKPVVKKEKKKKKKKSKSK